MCVLVPVCICEVCEHVYVLMCVFVYVCTHVHVRAQWCFWVFSSPRNYSETCEIEKQVGTPPQSFLSDGEVPTAAFSSPFILLRFPT